MADMVDTKEHLVIFEIAGETFGIDIGAVQEIVRLQQITDMPEARAGMKGVINLRGKVVPVIDLREKFGLFAGDETASSRIIVVDVLDATVGMIVDSVSEVLRIGKSQVEPPSPIIESYDKYLRGIGRFDDRLILLIDLEKLVPEAGKLKLVS